MRSIGEISNESDAKLFGDYLYVEGIDNDIDEENGEWTVWVHDDDQLDSASAALKKFRKDPTATIYREQAGKADRLRRTEEEEADRARKRQVDVRTQVFNTTSLSTPHLTLFLIGVSVIAFFMDLQSTHPNYLKISNYGPTQRIRTTNLNTGEVVREETKSAFLSEITGQKILEESEYQIVGRGQVWRLITPILLHFGLMHILFNMYMLYILGGLLEGRLGLSYMLAFLIITAVFSNLGQYIISGPHFGGMSGVNYGLFGYLWIRGKNDHGFGIQLDQSTITVLMVWFVLCFTGLLGPIANAAHTLGLMTGAAWGWLAARRAS